MTSRLFLPSTQNMSARRRCRNWAAIWAVSLHCYNANTKTCATSKTKYSMKIPSLGSCINGFIKNRIKRYGAILRFTVQRSRVTWHIPSYSWMTSGCLDALRVRVQAAPVGCRRPCSHSCRVRGEMS